MKRLILTLLLLAVMIGGCWGQGLTGTVSGVVRDPNGGVIPSAKVVVKNAATNAEFSTETNGEGYYRLPNLAPGQYSVSVQAAGFRRAEMPPQLLSVSANLRVDVALEIGQATETVTVTDAATLVNTEDAQMGRSLVDIPTLPNISGGAGRNALNLVTLQPGALSTSGAPSSVVGNWAVNGQRAQSNNFLLDGTDSNDLAINVPDAVGQISPNALAEFRVVTGAMKAEYGRNTGAVIEVVTKSGANQFHGSAQEVFRNTKLNASNFFQNVAPGGTKDYFQNGSKRKPQWNTNDYDAQLSGPIRKNKTFFFMDYLGFKRRQAQVTTATVFSDAERAAILKYGVPAAQAMVKLVPVASSGNTYFAALGNKFNRDQGMIKVDHRINDKNTLSGEYFIESQSSYSPIAFQGPPIPGFGAFDLTRFQNVILHDIHSFTPTLMNDARASFHRRGQPGVVPENTTSPSALGFKGIIPDDPSAAGPPFVDISGYSAIGNTYQGPQSRFDNTFQFADSLGWVKGAHSFKFGGDFKAYQQNQLFDFINNGYIYVDGAGTLEGIVTRQIPGFEDNPVLNDFANGFVTDFEQSNSGRQGYRDKFGSAFVQDDWKVRRNFTVNIGLRWEYNAPLTELNNQVITFRPGQVTTVYKQDQSAAQGGRTLTPPVGLAYYGDKGVTRSTYQRDLNNFAPRLGLAWDVRGNGTLSVRAGYGLFYDAPMSELTLQFLGNPPLGLQTIIPYSTDFTQPYATSVIKPIAQPFPFKPTPVGGTYDYTSVAPFGITIMDPNFRTPYSQQWNVQVQYGLANNWTLDVGYVGSSGTKLLSRQQLNPAMVTPTANSGNTDSRRLYNLAYPQQSADYGGAMLGGITNQASIANSIYNSLQVFLNKRMSNGLSMTHAYTWAHGLDNGSSLRVNGVGNVYDARMDRGNSDMDVRHRYVATLAYTLPFFNTGAGLLHTVLGGWDLSGVFTAQAGLPFNITEPDDRALTGGVGGNRPDYIGGEIEFVDPRLNLFNKQNSYFNGTGGGNASAATSPYFRRVGTSASAAKGAGRYGNFGRNMLKGPGIVNVDVRVAKQFSITERQKVQFQAEAFNLMNHTNFLNPSGNIGSSSFGRVTSARDPRLVQLTLQYSF